MQGESRCSGNEGGHQKCHLLKWAPIEFLVLPFPIPLKTGSYFQCPPLLSLPLPSPLVHSSASIRCAAGAYRPFSAEERAQGQGKGGLQTMIQE